PVSPKRKKAIKRTSLARFGLVRRGAGTAMKCVVTGAAGVIGAHLCEELLRRGPEGVGLGAFIPYYAPAVKRRNLAGLNGQPRFRFHELDLRTSPLDAVLAGAEVVFHVAAQAGLVKSWTDFEGYWTCNVQATQRLLEAIRGKAPTVPRL